MFQPTSRITKYYIVRLGSWQKQLAIYTKKDLSSPESKGIINFLAAKKTTNGEHYQLIANHSDIIGAVLSSLEFLLKKYSPA